MVDVKQAVQAATSYFEDLYSQELASWLRLEEVKLSEDESQWQITLSFVDESESHPLSPVLGSAPRHYKIFEIDADSGKVRSMLIRKINDTSVSQ